MSHDKVSWRSQEFNLLRLRVAFLQYFIDFTQLKLKNQNNLRKTIKKFAWGNYFSVTFRSTPPLLTDSSASKITGNKTHARVFFAVLLFCLFLPRLLLLLLLVHVFVSISAFTRPSVSLVRIAARRAIFRRVCIQRRATTERTVAQHKAE